MNGTETDPVPSDAMVMREFCKMEQDCLKRRTAGVCLNEKATAARLRAAKNRCKRRIIDAISAAADDDPGEANEPRTT